MTRILTAAVLIPVVLAAVFAGSWWLLAVIAAVAILSHIEYSQMLQIPFRVRALGMLAGLGLLTVSLDGTFLLMMLFGLVALAFPLGAIDLRTGYTQSAAMFLGVVYVFGGMKTAYLLGLRSPWWLLFALLINWIGDTGAFYMGRQFGKHKLAPRISPGKSWEGAVASVVFSTLFFALVVPRVLPLSIPLAILLAIAGNVAGQVGDLAESVLKRAAGVKDSSTLLPGHGGMLDRVDSALFTLPVIYSLTLLLHI